nr:hypothetical protein [Bradyrhizobium sp. NAS80.1]
MTAHRRRIKQTENLEKRLAAEARRLREEAEELPIGAARDQALRRACRCEMWVRSPGFRPPGLS